MRKKMATRLNTVIAMIAAVFLLGLAAPLYAADMPFQIEAENCSLGSGASVATEVYNQPYPGYSGSGFVWVPNAGTVTFQVEIPEGAMYEISTRCWMYLEGDPRLQVLSINGEPQGNFYIPNRGKWEDYSFGFYYLEQGPVTIEIGSSGSWGYVLYDTVSLDYADMPDLSIDPTPCDPAATSETRALKQYLTSVYGKKVISGQQEIYGSGHGNNAELEFEFINQKVLDDVEDNYPALRGFDLMNYNPLYGWGDGTTERIIEWVKERGGIATSSWHINIPKDFDNFDFNNPATDWQACTYKPTDSFNTANCLVEGTRERAYLMTVIDYLAGQLLILQENNVPIILRPFHEAEGWNNTDGSGAWFWWGSGGAEVFKELWKLLYTKLTEDYGLHNMLWEVNLYNFPNSLEWYPGDQYVDLVAYDKYEGSPDTWGTSAATSIFLTLVGYTNDTKMVAMAENDIIPDPQNMANEGAWWLYFCPWYEDEPAGGTATTIDDISGIRGNDLAHLKTVYNSDHVIKLNDLPDDLYGYIPDTGDDDDDDDDGNNDGDDDDDDTGDDDDDGTGDDDDDDSGNGGTDDGNGNDDGNSGNDDVTPNEAGYSWRNVTIGGGGFVSSIIAAPNDPNVFYARTDVGGAYRWNESSQSWIPMLDWVSSEETGYLGVDGIAVDPSVPGRVYVLLGIDYMNNGKSAFARSEDYGASWEVFDVTDTFRAHGNGMGRGNGERIIVDPNNSNIIFLGTRKHGLWKSTNRGTSWTALSLDYAPMIERDMHESGVCTLQIDKTSGSGGASTTIYAGVSRETDNVYVSHNGGDSWSLIPGQPTDGLIRPQRLALTESGRYLYITYGNGAGPHPMLWSGVTDYFNRGAIYKYDTQEGTWTDVSPENFMLNLDQVTNDETHLGAFSGITIDPNDENVILATSINSWRAPQFWDVDGNWVDSWGDNIYLSEDGGETWREMFRYYWVDGGMEPDYAMIDENGFPWIIGEKIHWNGAIVIDPNNSNRAFVVSGNGIFSTDNLHDSYTVTEWVDNAAVTKAHGKATWKFMSRGLEETVPLDMVSLPGGPLVSVIGDYDGFVHENLNRPSANGRLTTVVNGANTHVGTTTGLDFAAENPDLLAKAGGNMAIANGQEVTICGVTLSSDGGQTWNQIYSNPTGESVQPDSGSFFKGEVAMSADGSVVLWSPMSIRGGGENYHPELFRYMNSGWTKSQGVEFSCDPEADRVNANIMYAYDKESGYMYVSDDKGASFTQAGYAGTSSYWTARAVPGVQGDIWVPLAHGGLTRSTDAGQSFAPVNSVSWCEAVGFGKAASGASFPTVFIYGTVNGTTGVFRSTDQGASWLRVNDDNHEYGGPGNASMVIGDMNVFGRVYMSTAGRGIVYGEPSGNPVSVTGVSVAPSTATIEVGEAVRLTATVSPANATNKAVSWETSNASVATVNLSGLVTGQSAGQAIISVTTADGGFTATATVTVDAVDVNNDPSAAISATPTSGEAPLTVSFSAAGSSDPDDDTLSFAWEFGDGATASGVTASHTYNNPGDYVVRVTVTDGKGGQDVASLDISVSDAQQEIRYTLTLQSGDGGTISASPSPVGGTYAEGTEVTLIANAADGYAFAGWSGDAGGSASIITVVMNENKTIAAGFEAMGDDDDDDIETCEDPTPITLPYRKNGRGEFCWVTTQPMASINSWALESLTINGVDFTNTWASEFPQAVDGKWVIHYQGNRMWSHFNADPAEGTDVGDDDDDSGNGNTTPVQFSLVTTTTGSGTVSMAPSGGTYDDGSTVTLTATPAAGYEFAGWSGDAQGSSATLTLTMDDDKTVTAIFEEIDTPPTPSSCEDPTPITLPFKYDGAGKFCWVTSENIGHVNSWNLNSLTINGKDLTHTWASTMPPAAEGKWVISYDGSYGWSHFEASKAD